MKSLFIIPLVLLFSTPSSSSEMKDWTKCSQIEMSMNEYLGMHSVEWDLLKKLEVGSDGYMNLLDAIDKSLTQASKYATIYNAKCK